MSIQEEINKADAVVIGAGAGLSTAAGFTYSGLRFYGGAEPSMSIVI